MSPQRKSRADYPYVRLWGALAGSHVPHIKEQVALANKEKAPKTAIYRTADSDTGEVLWKTLEDITSYWSLKGLLERAENAGVDTKPIERRLQQIPGSRS